MYRFFNFPLNYYNRRSNNPQKEGIHSSHDKGGQKVQPWSLSINGMDEFKRSIIESSSNTGIVSVVQQHKRNRVRINDRCLV